MYLAEKLHSALVVLLLDQTLRMSVGALQTFLGDALRGRRLCQFEQARNLIREKPSAWQRSRILTASR